MYFMMKTQNLFFMSIHFLGAAFAEEYLYRQIIFNDIRRNYNAVLALLFSSLLFCSIKIKFKKLIYPTMVHAMYNIYISIM